MQNKTSVVLNPVKEDIYKNDNLSPQYVSVRAISRGSVFLDSNNVRLETNKTNLLMSTIKTPGDHASSLISNASRVAISSVGMLYTTPNVNPINNVLTIWSSNTNSFHTVTLFEGFYQTPLQIINEIVFRLNAISGATGLTFSDSVVAGFPDSYDLNSFGGTFYFKQDCKAVKYSHFGFSKSTTPASTQRVGTIFLFYTRYIDFTSINLTKSSKLKNKTSGPNGAIIYRLFIENPEQHSLLFNVDTNLTTFNFNPADALNIIDFQLFDEWGFPFYVNPNENAFQWDMILIIEA